MRLVAVIPLALACGSKPAVTPVVVVPVAPVKVAAPPAVVTCAEAAVILRGTVDDRAAAAQKEKTIAASCTEDRWPGPVVACVGGRTRAGSCLDGLTEEQRTAYGKRLAVWMDAHPNETLDRELTGWEPPPPPHLYTCNDPLGDPALYAPEVTATGADRELVVAMRKAAIQAQCATGAWEQDVLACLGTASPQACRAKLAPASAQALTDDLAKLDALAAKAFDARKKPANIDCKKVVAVHYADAAWTGKLAGYKPAERTKAISESRAAMAKACVDETWDELTRACIVGGGTAAAPCFAVSKRSPARWTFPALALSFNTGVGECDVMLGHMHVLATCDKATPQMREAYLLSSTQLLEMYRTMTPDVRAQAPLQCRQIDEAMTTAGQALGCPL